MISVDLLDRLLYEGESVALDFKSAQYAFIGVDDDEKSKLLKDVLAFANAWRRTDAYILIGVREVKGARAEIVGIADHIDDAQLQQFVNSKTQRPVNFAYFALSVEDKDIAVVHIPVQDRPVYLARDFGRLKADTVYVRRGSSTAVARPDEVASMGRVEDGRNGVALNVFFANPRTRESATPLIRSLALELPERKDIPDYSPRRVQNAFSMAMSKPRNQYYKELATYTRINRLVSPVCLAIANSGAASAQDVRLEVSIPGAKDGVLVLDVDQYPDVPRSTYDLVSTIPRIASRRTPELVVTRVGAQWLISARSDKVQPKSTVWFFDPVYVGSKTSIDLDCMVRVFADNLVAPHEQTLKLPIESTTERVDLRRVLELEAERFARSPEYLRFLKEQGLADAEPV